MPTLKHRSEREAALDGFTCTEPGAEHIAHPVPVGSADSLSTADVTPTPRVGGALFDDAFLTIRPLRFSTGPNFWTAESGGDVSWGISAPSVRELVRLLREFPFDDQMTKHPPSDHAERLGVGGGESINHSGADSAREAQDHG